MQHRNLRLQRRKRYPFHLAERPGVGRGGSHMELRGPLSRELWHFLSILQSRIRKSPSPIRESDSKTILSARAILFSFHTFGATRPQSHRPDSAGPWVRAPASCSEGPPSRPSENEDITPSSWVCFRVEQENLHQKPRPGCIQKMCNRSQGDKGHSSWTGEVRRKHGDSVSLLTG